MGGGKSHWIRKMLVYLGCLFAGETGLSGIRLGLFCEDFNALNDRHISRLEEPEFPKWMGTYNDTRKEFKAKPEYGGWVIAFRNLDDPAKYDSAEFAVIAIDEAQKNPVNVFNKLRTRLRWPGIDRPRMIVTANPGGELWVKEKFIDHAHPPGEEEAHEFGFVPSLATDNKYLPPSYMLQFGGMTDEEKSAYLKGNWGAFDTGMDGRGSYRLISDDQFATLMVPEVRPVGIKILGVDVGGGKDETAIVGRSDTGYKVHFKKKTKDTLLWIPVALELCDERGYKAIAVDANGIGKGSYDRAVELCEKKRIALVGFSAGEKPKNDEERFKTWKDETYWALREDLLAGARCEYDEGWNELKQLRYFIDSDGRRYMESKEALRKRGIKSPNVADAAAMTHAVDPGEIEEDEVYAGHAFHDENEDIWRGTVQ